MPNVLAPCPSCLRHVRADEAACAFCAAPLATRGASLRAALAVALGAGVAAVGACAPVYGGPPPAWNRGDQDAAPTERVLADPVPANPAPATPSASTPQSQVPPRPQLPQQDPSRTLAPAYGLPPPPPKPQ